MSATTGASSAASSWGAAAAAEEVEDEEDEELEEEELEEELAANMDALVNRPDAEVRPPPPTTLPTLPTLPTLSSKPPAVAPAATAAAESTHALSTTLNVPPPTRSMIRYTSPFAGSVMSSPGPVVRSPRRATFILWSRSLPL